MSVFFQGNFLFDADLDWVAEPTGNWRFEWSDKIGRTIGHLTYFRNENILSHTALARTRFPPMSADNRGYLLVDGQYAGLRLVDFPCILLGKIPERWSSRISSTRIEGPFRSYEIDDTRTSIKLDFPAMEDSSSFCFQSSWHGFWVFFRQKIVICSSSSKQRLVDVTYGDYQIRFNEIL